MRLRALVLCFALVSALRTAAGAEPPVRIGFEPADAQPAASSPLAFVDVLKQSGPWISSTPLALDGDGQVTSLSPGQTASRMVFAVGQSHPAGDYVLLYDGKGSFDVGGGSMVAGSPGRLVVRVATTTGSLVLRLVGVDPSDPVRDIRLIAPGFERSYAAYPFDPRFVASLRGAQTLRFAAWSRASTFAQPAVWPWRPRASRATQTVGAGIAPEYEIALANAVGADPWFALPAGATDAYVYGVADLVRRQLDPRLHPAFEYGDRIWSAGTPANAYARMAARNAGLPGDAATAALEWYALRTTQVFLMVDRAFGREAGRVVHALAVPAADNASGAVAAHTILTFAHAARAADELVVDADTDGALARTVALGHAVGGPIAAWRPLGSGRWAGVGMPARSDVPPDARLVFAAGADTNPTSERRARAPLALHIMPLVSARVASPSIGAGAGVSAALGDPLQDVDLTREGGEDWLCSLATGLAESKAAGRNRIAFSPTRGGVRVSGGFTSFHWSDGAVRSTGVSGVGFVTAGAGSGFRVSAPADVEARVLRIYAGAHAARISLTVRLDGRVYADRSLDIAGGTRESVYTLVYRARTPGRVDVEFTVDSTTTPSGGGVFRAATLAPLSAPPRGPALDESTYHNDRLRTGWNMNEFIFNTSNVASASFGLLQTLKVDGDVLAQPLFLSQVAIPGAGTHNLLVVATEHDSVYEFDADTGALINKANLGPAQSSSDVGCADISPEYGITSTPVIDRAASRIYVVAAVEPTSFVFHSMLHALDIATLKDATKPVEVFASTVLSNGQKITYDPQNQMNRASMVLANHSIYLGIGSHCDNNAGNIIGWVLRYDSSLHRIGSFPTTEDTDSYLLSSVWMSRFAPSVDESGQLFVATGNGSFDAGTGGKNFGESVLRLPGDLSRAADFFAPHDWHGLNNGDVDFGSGGVMLLPQQQAKLKYVAVAQGKASSIFLLNRCDLGKVRARDQGALQVIPGTGGGVWGGPAYYSGPTGQFVYYQAGGAPLLAFAVTQNKAAVPQLQLSSTGPSYAGYGGSTPVVSSDGQTPGTGIVWLVNRSTPLQLEAYDAADVSRLLFHGDAGVWRNPQANGFVTPLVANGRVYVPASKTISVFGLGSVARVAGTTRIASTAPGEHHITGTIVRLTGDALTMRLRDGRSVTVDITLARGARHLGVLPLGRPVTAYGTIDRAGVFHVTSVGHTNPDAVGWPADH